MKQKLKRAASGMLSVAMITSALLTDFTPPALAGEGIPADTFAGASGSVTSNYIAANLNVNSGQEAAASNEAAFTELVLSQMEAVSAVSLYSGDEDAISASDNDAEDSGINPDDLKELVDGLISEMDGITPAGDYDENGLAPTYHYITLNYSLVEKSAVWDGMTINDIWNKTPESFIASYLTTLNVYTQEGNEDYFVALANPAALNGLGNAVYADFSDGNTEAPTVYNDQISFDAETGLIYIPKSFYYNESGEEVLRQLEAQVLVPYSFEDDTASISVTSESEMEGVTALSGKTETAALDVTVTVPVVDSADAGKISIEDLYVTVNNDPLAFDLTNGGGYYDQETGELTIAAAGNTVYAVDVKIRKDAAEEATASADEKEVLIASIGDLSGILARDVPFYGDVSYATSAEGMKTLPGVSITADGVVRGQTYTYSGAYQYITNSTDAASKIITATAPYCYYYISGGSNTAVDGSNMGGVNADGSVTIKNLSSGSTALLNTAKPDSTFNRIAALPQNASLTSSDGKGTMNWTCDITGNPSGYKHFVALHCVDSGTASTGVASGTGNLTIRILYHKAATTSAKGYTVFSVTSPTAYTQAGCAVYKVEENKPAPTNYYAQFGVNKVSSANSSTKLSAYFAYDVSTSDPAKNKAGSVSLTTNLLPREKYAAGLAEAYEDGTLSTTGVTSMLGTYFDGAFTTSTSGVGQVTLNSDTCNALANCNGDPIYVTLAEVIPAEGYVRRTGVWVLKITPSTESYSKSTLNSVTYYSYNASSDSLNAGTGVSKNDYYFTVTNTPESYYAKVGFDKYAYSAGNTAGARLSGAVIGIANSETNARNGALSGGTSYAASTLTTSSSAAIYYQASLGQGVKTKTIYAYEASAPSGYARNTGYWKINVQGVTDTSGAGTKVISAVYYAYSSASGKWSSYDLNTSAHYDYDRGWYTQGSDTVIPVVHVTDKKESYYYRFGINKFNIAKNKIDGAVFTVSTGISSVTSTGCTQTGTTWTLKPSASAGAYIPAYTAGSDTYTFWVKETTAPSGYVQNTGLWLIQMKGTLDSDAEASSITSVTYYPAGTPMSTGYKLPSRTSGDSTMNVSAQDGYYLGDYCNREGHHDYLALVNTQPAELYGQFSIQKVDENGEAVWVSGIRFNVYSDMACTETAPVASIETNEKGVASYPCFGWTANADGTNMSRTFYIKEDASTVPVGMMVNTDVYKVVLTGSTESADKCYIAVTCGAAGETATTALGSGDVENTSFILPNIHKTFHGVFGIQKVDEEGNPAVVSGVKWNVYTDAACTVPAATESIISDKDGVASYPEITWKSDDFGTNETQTFYIKEDVGSVPAGMTVNTNVYKIVLTGSTERADKCVISVTYGATGDTATTALAASDIDRVNLRFNFMNPRKKYQAAFEIYKTDEVGQPIEGIQFGIYTDEKCTTPVSGNHVITTGADGHVTYTLEPWHSYSGENRKTLYVKELGQASGNVWYVMDSSVYRFEITGSSDDAKEAVIKVTNLSTGEDVTVNSKSSAGCNLTVTNELVRLYGMIAIEKTDENQNPIEAVFEVYTDEALTKTLGTITTDAQTGIGELRLSDYYDWTRKEHGDIRTLYLVEKSNDGCHVRYPYIIKADIYGKAAENKGMLTDSAAIRRMEEQCTVTYSTLPLSEADEASAAKNGYSSEISYADTLTGAYGAKVINYSTKVAVSKTNLVTGKPIENAVLTIYKKNKDGSKGDALCSWVTDTESHCIECIPVGDYILEETYAPLEDGYVKAEDIAFTVLETSEIQTVEMRDDFTKVHVSKKDFTDGEEIPGAELTVYKTNPDGTKGEPVESWITDGTPHVIKMLKPGIYILEETQTPDHYQRAENVVFTVSATGEIQKVEMYDWRTYGKVEVQKVDESNHPVAGVEFTIINKNTGEIVDTITTDADGYACSKELPIDDRGADGELYVLTYVLTETYAPAGVVLNTEPEEFAFCYADDETPVISVGYTRVNRLQRGRIAIMKKGMAVVGTEKEETEYGTVDKLVFGYVYLPGAEFTIYADRALTEPVAVVTTDMDGYALSEYLPVGTYYVVETYTPVGYAKDDTVYTFTIDCIAQSGEGIEYVLDVTKNIENHLCSSTLNIYKVGADLQDGEKRMPLENVFFGVYADEDIKNVTGRVVVKEGARIAVIRTNADGVAAMTENLPAGKYYYKELKTQDHFVLDDTAYQFEVALENDNAVIEVNKTNPLVNYAKNGTLTIHKVDQDGRPLGAGVEFILTCAETGERWVLVTDEDGTVSIGGLPIGRIENGAWVYFTYTLRETKTLENYKLNETVYTFSFTAENTDADALYQSFTVRNVILGIEDYSMAGGFAMLLAALVMLLMAAKRRKEGHEKEKTEQSRFDFISDGCNAGSRRNIHDILP